MPGTLPNLDLVPTLRSVPGINAIAGAARRVAGAAPGHDDDLSVERMLAPRTSLHRRIDFGIIGDREDVPDVWFPADAGDDAYAELLALVPARAKPRAGKRAAKA